MVGRGRAGFTIEEANRSLPLVRSIVTDVAALWRDLLKAREDYGNSSPEHDRLLRELSENIQELHGIGCHLRDFEAGLVDFPGARDAHGYVLTWRLGEEQVTRSAFARGEPTDVTSDAMDTEESTAD